MKRIYKIPFAWLLGLLLCGSLSFQANAQQLDNLLAMNVEPSTVEKTDKTKEKKKEATPVGCIGGYHVKVNGGGVQCGFGDSPVQIVKHCVNGNTTKYEVRTLRENGSIYSNTVTNTTPVIEIRGPGEATYRRLYVPKEIEAMGCDKNKWNCDIYDPERDDRPPFGCKKCTADELLEKAVYAATGTGLLVFSAWNFASTPVIPVAGLAVGTLALTGSALHFSISNSVDCNLFRKTKFYKGITKPSVVGLQIKPNPATSVSTLSIQLPQKDDLTVEIFDLNGKHQQTVMAGAGLPAGANEVPMPVGDLAPGIYIVKITSAESGIKLTQRLVKK